jgi:hypothetical protein
MISILINDEIKIHMNPNSINRGNRTIYTSNNILNKISLNGNVKIYKDGHLIDEEIVYKIEKLSTWYQLNTSTSQLVVQFKIKYENNTATLIKVAIQEISKIKDVLIHL